MPALQEWDEKIQAWASDRLKDHDASHDVVHARNVARMCNAIMTEDPQFDGNAAVKQAILCIAWTHDICDRKYAKDDKETVVSEICKMLERMGITTEALEIVRTVVGTISFSARLERVAQGSRTGEPCQLSGNNLLAYRVVSDADMLESMGIVGIVRTFMYQAVVKQTSKTAFSHIQDRLVRCKDYLHFGWSIKEGVKRYEAMQNACNELKRERYPL